MKDRFEKRGSARRSMPIIGCYVVRVLLIVAFFISIGLSIYTIYSVKQYTSEIKQYRTYISELNNNLLGNAEKENAMVVIQMPEHKYISGVNSESVNFADAVAILQTQQEQYNNNVNVMFAVLSIVITAVTIVIPIFNYTFVQKEHIDKIETFSKELEKQASSREKEYEDLKKRQEEEQKKQREEYQGLVEELRKEVARLDQNYAKVLENKRENIPDNMENGEKPCVSDLDSNQRKHIFTLNPPMGSIDNNN